MNEPAQRRLSTIRWLGWVITHLLALGIGWWVACDQSAPGGATEEIVPPRSSGRELRSERRVSSRELIEAYGNSEFLAEAQARRPKYPWEVSRSANPPMLTPEQRAAEIKDISAAMQHDLEAVNGRKPYDYEFARALITRWMKEDAKACAAWLGKMESRINWMDPFEAFASSRPPMEVLDLMEDGWLGINRSRALQCLAQHVGKAAAAASLPEILARLGGDGAKGFLQAAAREARAEDAAIWLQLAGDDRQMLSGFAQRWLNGAEAVASGSSQAGNSAEAWLRQAGQLLETAAGTPAEDLFKARFDDQRKAVESAKLLAMVATDPKAAFSGLVARAIGDGHGEEEATRIALKQIEDGSSQRWEKWDQGAWQKAIQQSLTGDRSFEEVLGGRFDAIRDQLPEPLQAAPRTASLSDALTVNPDATVAFASQRGMLDEAVRGAVALLRGPDAPLAVQADILGVFAREGLWDESRGLPDPQEFAEMYARNDPEAAKAWRACLPKAINMP